MISKRNKLIGLLASCSLLCSCGIGDGNGLNMQEVAEGIKDIANIRYYGYSDGYNELIENVCDRDSSKEIINSLNSTSDNTFISLEEYFRIYESETVTEVLDDGTVNTYNPYYQMGKGADGRIQTVDGVRGIYSDDIWADEYGKASVYIYGDYIDIDVPYGVVLSQLRGNPEYRFKVTNYNYYDNGKFTLVLESDIVGAFEEIYDSIEIGGSTGNYNLEGLLTIDDIGSDIRITQDEYEAHRISYNMSYEIRKVKISGTITNGKVKINDINKIVGLV